MARIRTIKPEMPGSASLATCSRDARLLFVWLITDADDVGRVAGSAKRLAGQLFPHDDDVTPAHVDAWLDELYAVGVVRAYHVKGARYLQLVGWGEHQKIHKPSPSRLPDPPDQNDDTSEDAPAGQRLTPEQSAESPRTARGHAAEPPGPTTHAPARVLGPRSLVEGTKAYEVERVGKSLVRAPEGSAPRLRSVEPATLTSSLGAVMGRLR